MAFFAPTYLQWTKLTMPSGPTEFTNPAHQLGVWYIVGRSAAGAMSMYETRDGGAAWQLYDDTLPTQALPAWGNAFVAANGWFAIGGAGSVRYFSPENGVFSWGSVAPAGAGTPDTKVSYVGGLFIVYNSNGMLVGKTLGAGMEAVARPATAVAYNGSGLFACGGTDGYLYTSPDCLTWTQTAFSGELDSITAVFNYLTYIEGVWYAGVDNAVHTSTDLVTWTFVTYGGASASHYANGLCIMAGSHGFKTVTPGALGVATENPTDFSATDASISGGVWYGGGNWMICTGTEAAVSRVQNTPSFNRLFQGTVADSAGTPASRRVSLLRADHSLIASTMSATDGTWSLYSSHAGETIALISGEPAKNALVFERITPP